MFWGNVFIDFFSTSSCSCSFFCFFSLFCLTAEIKHVHVGWLTVSTAASGSWWSCTAPVRGEKKEKIIFSGCKINTSKAQRPSSEVWLDSPEWIWQLWRVFLKNCSISEWFQRHVNGGRSGLPFVLTLCESIHQSTTAWLTKPLRENADARQWSDRLIDQSINNLELRQLSWSN